jgi:hypothetical protein
MKKSQLSLERSNLLEKMQVMNFGRIENLRIERGVPKFTQDTHVVREVKLGSRSGPRPERDLTDFVLCAKAEEFFAELTRIDSGTVTTIEIQNGIPFRFSVREPMSA